MMQPGPHGVFRAPDHIGNFFRGKAFDLEKDEHRAFFGRQLAQHAVEGGELRGALGRIDVDGRLFFYHGEPHGFTGTATSAKADSMAGCDTIDPGPKLSLATEVLHAAK